MGNTEVKPGPTPRKADSVAKIYTHIRNLAVGFQLRPGEPVREGQLANSFGISRTPVREALNRLVSEGFITFEPNRGFFCRKIHLDEISDLYDLRAALETWAFRQACVRGSDKEITEVCRSWSKAGRRSGTETLAQYDEHFHRAIAMLSGNAQLLQTLDSIGARILFFRKADLDNPRRKTATLDEHQTIITALRERDADAGTQCLEEHILKSAENAVCVASCELRKFRDEVKYS